jgi:Fe-S-cluster-containing dehydrogenase component
MMKCDMCYDRTSVGKRPMCATVCPSQALFFGTREELAELRPQSMPTNRFRFGDQTITTRVHVMVPRTQAPPPRVDVTAAMDERAENRTVRLHVLEQGPPSITPLLDPFAEVEV